MSSTDGRNKLGYLPPYGCKLPSDDKHPEIAVGSHSGEYFEETFLVKSGELEEFLFDIMQHSWTLKAWFAYKLRDKDLKEKCHLEAKSPTWQQICDLIDREDPVWSELYASRKASGTHTTRWELHEPRSILDLWARTIVVLNYKIQARTNHNDPSVRGLKWHNYYYEDEGRCFALYKFMLFQHRLFMLGRANSIFVPLNERSMRSWRDSYGCKIRQAAEKFMKDTGWDPLSMMGSLLCAESTRPHNQRNRDKIVTFVETRCHMLRVHKRNLASIRQQEGQRLQKALYNILGITPKSVFTGRKNLRIDSFERLLAHVESHNDPAVWLRNDSEPSLSPSPTPVETQTQRDYSNHAILNLEDLVEHLSNKDRIRSASARFSLLRENHPHSADFVKDLEVYFAPLQQTTTAEWQELSERKRLCQGAMEDQTQFDKLREFTAALSAEQQAHAQQYFALVNTTNPLAGLAAENLVKLLNPDEAHWQSVSATKDIFDAVEKGD